MYGPIPENAPLSGIEPAFLRQAPAFSSVHPQRHKPLGMALRTPLQPSYTPGTPRVTSEHLLRLWRKRAERVAALRSFTPVRRAPAETDRRLRRRPTT